MKRLWIIAGVLGMLLMGVIFFFVFRDKPVENDKLLPEGTMEELVSEEGESSAEVLEDMPKQPDFRSITETIFLNEGVAEAKSFEAVAIAPLEELQRLGTEMKVRVEQKETNWCAPLLTSSLAGQGMSNEEYQGNLQEEREIRDVKFLSQAVQSGDEWSLWLVRLTEAANREEKKKEKAVEEFQESFNEITDEYEETLYQSAGTTREKIDQIIFSEKEIALLPSKLTQELSLSLEEELNACRENRILESGEHATLSRSLGTWETKVANALTRRKSVMNQVLDVPLAAARTLVSKTQEHATRFETALVELEQALQ